MGGQLALFAAAEYPDRIAAAVDFYGIHPHAQIDLFNDTRPEVYDRDDADLAWTRTLAFLREHLA